MISQAAASGEGPPKKEELGYLPSYSMHGGVCLPAVNLVSSVGNSEPGQLCSVKQSY